jgi:hypothetical protein
VCESNILRAHLGLQGTACPLGRIAFPVPDEADVEELGEEDRVLLEASRVLGDGLQSIRNLHWNIPT